jgi:phage terminase Nu1 subunit (DNA packaging protein)
MNTEQLRDHVIEIRRQLRDGKISNSAARKELARAKAALATLKKTESKRRFDGYREAS